MGMLLILLWIFVNAQCVVSTSSTDSEVLASSSLRGNAISGEYSQNERQLWGWDFQNLMCKWPSLDHCYHRERHLCFLRLSHVNRL